MIKNNTLTADSDNIKIEGHIGTWYVIDQITYDRAPYTLGQLFLLEHEDYGDEAACLIVDSQGNIVMEDVWNGFDDLLDNLDESMEMDKFE